MPTDVECSHSLRAFKPEPAHHVLPYLHTHTYERIFGTAGTYRCSARIFVKRITDTAHEGVHLVSGRTLSLHIVSPAHRSQVHALSSTPGPLHLPANASPHTSYAPVMGLTWILLISRQGKVRLAKWFTTLSPKSKAKITKDVTQLVLARRTRMCNFLEYKDTKVVYRRYASLFFVSGIATGDNELVTLEMIHRYVEVLDRYFGNVSSERFCRNS